METEKRTAGFRCLIEEKNIWFFAFRRNYLCCFNLETKNKKTYPLPNCGLNGSEKQLYHFILKIGSRILLVPRVANVLMIYDIEEEKFYTLKLPKETKSNEKYQPDEAKFCNGFTKDKYFYLFGLSYQGIVRINSENFEVEMNDKWREDIDKVMPNLFFGYFSFGNIADGHNLFLPLVCKQMLMSVNLDTLETSVEYIDGPFEGGIYGLSGSSDSIWITGWKENYDVVVNIVDGNIRTYSINDLEEDVRLFYPPVISEYGVFLVPVQYEKSVYKFDDKTESFVLWKKFEHIEPIKRISGYSFMTPEIIGKDILLIDGENFEWHLIDMENGNDISFNVDVSDEPAELDFWSNKITEIVENNTIIQESELSLELYLKAVSK